MKTHLLPPEIMLEIFLLLPLESILACKLVSKEWNNVVKHPVFIKHYIVESTSFFVSKNTVNCLFRRDDVNSYMVRPLPIKLDHQYHKDNKCPLKLYPFEHTLLVESSNKIACVKEANGSFLLYNLFTGDSCVVPHVRLQDHHYFSSSFHYGFGYDCYEDDYKIAVLCCDNGPFMSLLCSSKDPNPDDVGVYNAKGVPIYVYSYRNRGWRSLRGFPHGPYFWSSVDGASAAYSFNGVLHWVVQKGGPYRSKVVVALDLHSYGFAEMALPPPYYNTDISTPRVTLTELDGHLCCLLQGSTFEVWVMKEYGVAESWTELFSVNEKISCTVLPYKCRDAGNLVLFVRSESKIGLVRYNVDNDEVQVFSEAPRRKRMLLKRLTTRFKKACCLIS